MKGDLKQQRLDPRSAAKGKLGGAQKARQFGGTFRAMTVGHSFELRVL